MSLLGLVCGLLAALPAVLLLRSKTAGMGGGIAAVAFSFVAIQVCLFLVHWRWPSDLIPFGTLAVLTYLGAIVAAVVSRELS